MSRLTELIRQAKEKDPALGAELEREYRTLSGRRAFGLNFERHRPEAVELPGRPVRRGDKVRILPPRGSSERGDQRLWRVVRIEKAGGARLAHLERGDPGDEEERTTAAADDLVVVAEFRDPIHPGLVPTGSVHRGGDKPAQTVINGENFHVLRALTYTHRGRVDAIYIDPPYNTGARDWKYNNDYVEGDDLYRHSKWLAFMERRLLLAKELLNPQNSVLIVAIDENEVHRVGLLLEQLFSGSKVQMVTVLSNPAGASIIDQFSRVDEQMFFVHIGSARPARTTTDTTPGTSTFVTADGRAKPFTWESFLRSGGNSRRQDTKAKFFPIWIDPSDDRIVGCGDHLPSDLDRTEAEPPPDGAVAQWPLKTDGSEACWQTSAPTFRQYLSEGRIKLGRRDQRTGRYAISFLPKGTMRAIAEGELVAEGRDERGSLIVRNAEGRVRSQIGKTIWSNVAYSATEYGSTLLRSVIPSRRFPFPKSLYVVEDALRYYVGKNTDAVVLDFFAGSDTTAHAVMRLNRQDGGRRQCISVTNNEASADEQKRLRESGLRPGDPEWEALGICDHITKPRIAAAITGRTPEGEPIKGDYKFADEFPMAEGFEENAEFFTLTYENPVAIGHNQAFERVAPLLWLRAGAQGRRIDAVPAAGWEVADAYGILFDLDVVGDFAQAVEQGGRVRLAYVVTDDDRRFQSVVRQLPEGVEVVRLYESYLSNFRFTGGEP